MYQIREVARMAHVSPRALRHYDDIGLLRPDFTSPAGYRLYSEATAQRLREILFYKAVGFDLMEIKDLLQQSTEERRSQLISRRQRVQNGGAERHG
ncbi:MAG: MerR family transcriptional regulator [Firmicutes bacterium]|nr:MerR family transcriptional regulator [Bacillota bacterium]